jgi:flagellar biosynthesis/type III secretory pathway protein FliH
VATKVINKKIIRSQSDTAWKDILDNHLKDFLDYCLPELSEQIDWSRGCVSLDKELQAITKGNLVGTRLVDKLIKVFLKNGKSKWLLIHVEVQGNPDTLFPERMFIYSYRLYDKYQQPLYSVAILTEDQADWRPSFYEMRFADSCLRLDYHVIKLLDYRTEKEKLENDMNPFASVILVQLAALETKNKSDQVRLNTKLALTKRLYKKGFSKELVQGLYLFIDWLISLPKELELEYHDEIYKIEEIQAMSYISNAERFGIEKGREQGMQVGLLQGMQEGVQKGTLIGLEKGRREGRAEGESVLLLKQLSRKFGALSLTIRARIENADSETLLRWGEQLIDAKSIEEVFQ